MILNSPTISGSLTVTGNIIASGSITLSGSVASASFATSASNATNAISASYANNLTVAGTLTAQTLVVQTITSSVLYSSGSNVFGNNIANTQTFTGSVNITGSVLNINSGGLFVSSSGNVGIGTILPTDIAGYTSLTINNSASGPLIDLNNSGTNNMRLLCLSAADQRIYGSGALSFYTSGSNRMSITSTGLVGVGTSSPAYFLDVLSTNQYTARFNSSAAQGGFVAWAKSGTAYGYVGNAYHIVVGGTDGDMAMAATANMVFSTSGTLNERMRIASGGNVGIGTSSPSDLLTVAGTIISSNATANTAINPGYIQANYPGNSNTAGTAVAHLRLGDTTNSRFWMQQIDTSYQYATFYFDGGSWTKVGYQTVGGTWTNSDERRKENIELSTYGLNEVLQLQPKKFNFKTDERKIINLGFIAQDVLPIIPEAVQTDIDDTEEYYAMNYVNLVPVLTKAIQELNTKFEEYKATHP